MPRKNEFNILIAFLHISGLLIYLEFKIKKQFLKKLSKNLWLATMILDVFSKIVFNPLKLRTFKQLSFCADQWGSITAVIHFKIILKTTFYSFLLCIHLSVIHCRQIIIGQFYVKTLTVPGRGNCCSLYRIFTGKITFPTVCGRIRFVLIYFQGGKNVRIVRILFFSPKVVRIVRIFGLEIHISPFLWHTLANFAWKFSK